MILTNLMIGTLIDSIDFCKMLSQQGWRKNIKYIDVLL